MSKKEIVTYVYPVQSSTWFDPWLTATKTHSAHSLAERSMAGAFSYNPSTKMCVFLLKRNTHPRYSSAMPGAQVFVYGYYDCLSIWSGESLSIDCWAVTRLHPTFPKIFDTTPPPKVQYILKRQASTITEEGFQSFDLSVPGSFRLTTNQRVKI
jgi:hypothetical protein